MRIHTKDTDLTDKLGTQDSSYTNRLLAQGSPWWKKALDVQAPYRRHLQSLNLGFTLDLGCGLGRNLINLNGNGVGIDHNPHSIEIAKTRGLVVFTPLEFSKSSFNKDDCFDSILLSHVAEHMREDEVTELLNSYMPNLKPGGLVVFICPQEYGYRSDPTHIQFLDFELLRAIAQRSKLSHLREYSFPFPRLFGHLFKYNEFVSISRKEHV